MDRVGDRHRQEAAEEHIGQDDQRPDNHTSRGACAEHIIDRDAGALELRGDIEREAKGDKQRGENADPARRNGAGKLSKVAMASPERCLRGKLLCPRLRLMPRLPVRLPGPVLEASGFRLYLRWAEICAASQMVAVPAKVCHAAELARPFAPRKPVWDHRRRLKCHIAFQCPGMCKPNVP